MEPDLVYAGGSAVNIASGGMLHHAVFFNNSRDDVTCSRELGIGQLGERFFAAGNERTIVDFPKHYGYYNGSGDRWVLLHDIKNFTDTPSEVYVEVKFTHVPDDPHMRHVTPVWIDQAICMGSDFSVPAGYSDSYVYWESTLRGKMVAAGGGHVHNFGTSTVLEDSSAPGKHRVVCASVAGYAPGSSWVPIGPGTGDDESHPASPNTPAGDPDYQGRLEDMSPCYAPPYGGARHIRKGDVRWYQKTRQLAKREFRS